MGQGNSTPKISAQDKAILDMKIQRDRLRQYQKKISVITDRETAVARECLRKGDKKKALVALRRKKYQESLLQKTDAQLAQLEVLTNDVEFALVQKDVLFGLKQGTAVLKQIHEEMGGIENVEKLLNDSEEARVYQKEVNEMLAGRMSNQEEDEVEEELEALERELTGVRTSSTALRDDNNVKVPDQQLPDAPSQDPITKIESRKERWERRAREQQAEAMLA